MPPTTREWRPLNEDELEERFAEIERRAATPVQLRFTTDKTNARKAPIITQFMHRDGRFWHGRIVKLPAMHWASGELATHVAPDYYVGIQSSGCRPMEFFARTIPVAKRTIERFANLPLPQYARWVLDATNTWDFRNAGEIVHVRIDPGSQREITVPAVWSRDGIVLTVLPDDVELRTIMQHCAAMNVRPIYEYVEELTEPLQYVERRPRVFTFEAPPVPSGEGETHRQRNMRRLMEASRQSSELYSIGGREQRTIDLE